MSAAQPQACAKCPPIYCYAKTKPRHCRCEQGKPPRAPFARKAAQAPFAIGPHYHTKRTRGLPEWQPVGDRVASTAVDQVGALARARRGLPGAQRGAEAAKARPAKSAAPFGKVAVGEDPLVHYGGDEHLDADQQVLHLHVAVGHAWHGIWHAWHLCPARPVPTAHPGRQLCRVHKSRASQPTLTGKARLTVSPCCATSQRMGPDLLRHSVCVVNVCKGKPSESLQPIRNKIRVHISTALAARRSPASGRPGLCRANRHES